MTIYSIDFPQGAVLDESYLFEGIFTQGNIFVKLGENEYFVLGDNRQASSDSRQWGALAKEYIIGKVWVRAWPFDAFTVF